MEIDLDCDSVTVASRPSPLRKEEQTITIDGPKGRNRSIFCAECRFLLHGITAEFRIICYMWKASRISSFVGKKFLSLSLSHRSLIFWLSLFVVSLRNQREVDWLRSKVV